MENEYSKMFKSIERVMGYPNPEKILKLVAQNPMTPKECIESLYYTPDISDIYIGYKCESTNNGKNWYDWIFQEHNFAVLELELMNTMYRTKYLTKENIESLDWKVKNIYQDSDNFDKNSFISLQKDKYEIRWWGNPDYIEIYESYQIGVFTPEDKIKKTEYDCIYQGTCKSINELKTIFKLLNI